MLFTLNHVHIMCTHDDTRTCNNSKSRRREYRREQYNQYSPSVCPLVTDCINLQHVHVYMYLDTNCISNVHCGFISALVHIDFVYGMMEVSLQLSQLSCSYHYSITASQLSLPDYQLCIPPAMLQSITVHVCLAITLPWNRPTSMGNTNSGIDDPVDT